MNALRRNTLRAFSRYYSEEGGAQSSSSSPSDNKPIPEVPGLSSAVINPAPGPVGPNVDPSKSGTYKVPEYYCYNNMSFFEAEIEMSRYRLPPPSALKK